MDPWTVSSLVFSLYADDSATSPATHLFHYLSNGNFLFHLNGRPITIRTPICRQNADLIAKVLA
ncbi:hypothetical protein RvY_17147 [Ramazzottius varieornatus]|uniref:Uncharacterized protein n=1 Tax=Ramazzottius varieornatus TaxID=947166 RepID=A0A1D1W135_RAMVA|nr:hypothetical protein RvY_17147 [Ramazzottius varieornatus]